MSRMDALDGNAIAGQLVVAFGHEMTTASGVCGRCGGQALLAETNVYLRAPGSVARCRACDNVLVVMVEVRGYTVVDLTGFSALEPA